MQSLNDPSGPDEPEAGQQDLLLAFLAEHDAPCPACGYNLRQLSRPVCPECGLSLKLSVGSDEPFKRAWAIALTLNAMIAGVGALCIVMTIFAGAPGFYDAREGLIYFGVIAAVPMPILLFVARQWFCRQSKAVQYGAIALTVGWILGLLALLISMVVM